MSEKNSKEPTQYGKLRPSEIALSIIAGLMLLGWAFRWMDYGGPPEASPETTPEVFPWFGVFSIPSAILVIILIFLKLNCMELLPRKGQEKILPYISLLPVLGFLIAELGSVQTFLTVGGAMALAYISATSYWRNYIPDFITNPLGADAPDSGSGAQPAKKPEKTPEKAPSTPPSPPEEGGAAASPSEPEVPEDSKKETEAKTDDAGSSE